MPSSPNVKCEWTITARDNSCIRMYTKIYSLECAMMRSWAETVLDCKRYGQRWSKRHTRRTVFLCFESSVRKSPCHLPSAGSTFILNYLSNTLYSHAKFIINNQRQTDDRRMNMHYVTRKENASACAHQTKLSPIYLSFQRQSATKNRPTEHTDAKRDAFCDEWVHIIIVGFCAKYPCAAPCPFRNGAVCFAAVGLLLNLKLCVCMWTSS